MADADTVRRGTSRGATPDERRAFCPPRGAADPRSAATGLVTYDAKDPDTAFPPIEELRPPAGAPNVLVVLIDDVGFGASSAFGGPCATPNAERLAAGGPEVQPLPHDGAVLADARGAAHAAATTTRSGWAASPRSRRRRRATTRSGRTRARRWRRSSSSTATPPPSSASATRCRSGRPARSGRSRTGRRGSGFEYFYGFIGGEAHQYYPALYEGTTPVEPDRTPEEGYHLMGDMTDKAIKWIRQQKSLMPDKPFFMYFAPGATHAPHHVPREWADKYAGQFDDGWDALRERDLRAPEGARRDPGRRRADAAPRRDPGLGRHARGAQAGAPPPDGGLRRLPRVHRPPRRAAVRRARGARGARRHARLLHHRRQRGLGRGHAERHVQRDDQLQRRRRAGDAGVHDRAARRLRRAGLLQPLRGRLGARDGHAVPVDQAGRLALRAARATARSCTGRAASRRRARSGPVRAT